MQFTPSIWLFSRLMVGGIIAAICLSYLWQGYYEGHWWSAGYVFSLAVPVIVFPLFVWFAFVPKELSASNDSLAIHFYFRRKHVLGWSDLQYWGNQAAFLVFYLKFKGLPTFQIALFAFPSNQRRQLLNFLENHYPERKAKSWVGPWGFRR
jgi:hypothetical protein